MAENRIVVVGGGVIGCSLAYHLSGAGQIVTVLERSTVAAEASSAAAGMLAPVAESDEPGAFTDLAIAGLRAFQEDAAAIESVSGLSIEYRPSGIVRTAREPQRAAALKSRTGWAKAAGLPVRWLDRDELLTLEPSIGKGVLGGLDSPEEGQVNPRRLTQALAQGAGRRGAGIREGCDVDSLIRSGDEVRGVRLASGESIAADTVVLAGGPWTRFLARDIADLPVYPVLGQYLILRRMPCPFRRVLYGEDAYLLPRPDGTIYLGATEEPEAGFHKRVSVEGIRRLLNAGAALVPSLDGAELVIAGAGLRPRSADRMPLIGYVAGVSGLAVATGHFRNGVLLSLITGRAMTELLVFGRTSVNLAPFAPGRNYDSIAGSVESGQRDGNSEGARNVASEA